MVVLGIDTHKRTHTVVAVDDLGRRLGERTVGTTTRDHLGLVAWADGLDPDRVADQVWAVEDCRNLSRRLERDLLAAGRRLVRVHPKLMAHMRDAARSYGKSDPIDALAVARAALRETGLPPPGWTGLVARSAYWSIIATISLGSGPASSTGFAGTCTNWTHRWHCRAAHCTDVKTSRP